MDSKRNSRLPVTFPVSTGAEEVSLDIWTPLIERDEKNSIGNAVGLEVARTVAAGSGLNDQRNAPGAVYLFGSGCSQSANDLGDAARSLDNLFFLEQETQTEAHGGVQHILRNAHRLQDGGRQERAARTCGAGGAGDAGQVEVHQ